MLAQQREKLRLQVEAYALAGLDAFTPGEGDLALGPGELEQALRAHELPAISANLRCQGRAPWPASRRVAREGITLGFVGVIEPALVPTASGCQAEPALPAVTAAIQDLGQVDAIVLLSHMTAAAEGELVGQLPRPVLVVNGHARLHTERAQALPGGSARLASGSRGKELGLARLRLVPGAVGFDAEAAEGQARKLERLEERRKLAQANLEKAAAGSPEEKQARQQLAFYDRELEKGRAEAAASRPVEGPRNGLQVELVGLGADVGEHPATEALVKAALLRIAQAEVGPLPEGATPFVGSASCLTCHPAEHAQWQGTAHARAWSSLEAAGRAMDQACFSCHVTGALDPDGPQHPAQVSAALREVGCEGCHGAGQRHLAQPERGTILRDPPVQVCQQCHDGKMDEGRFDFGAYRPKIVHGARATATTPP